MTFKFAYKLAIVTAFAVTMFFSCKNNFKAIQKVGVLQDEPIAEAENIDLKYTEFEKDTVRLVANLLSPEMLDFSNREFGAFEFPKGIELRIYDKNGKKTTVFSDYAIMYDDTKLIDLQDNVIIATHDKDTLFTEQLYYDQKIEWLFTNEPFLFKRVAGFTKGNGFDSDRAFKKRQILEMGGDFEFDN